jgi:Ran GTPase-activating protein (RanGAP) involved in mRNA processing and transport
MIAESLEKCENMQLVEFYASRDRLEQEGMEAMAQVFKKQKCLEKIEVYQNGSKKGLIALLDSLAFCKDTLREVNISDNKSINRAVPQLV